MVKYASLIFCQVRIVLLNFAPQILLLGLQPYLYVGLHLTDVLRDSLLQYNLIYVRYPVTFQETHQHGFKDPQGNHFNYGKFLLRFYLLSF
jgi:hypothetical protein